MAKETKATTKEKKSWKVKFAELEAKLAAMNATTTSRGTKAQMTPSLHADGGFVPNDEEFGNFTLSSTALSVADMTLEAFAYTRS